MLELALQLYLKPNGIFVQVRSVKTGALLPTVRYGPEQEFAFTEKKKKNATVRKVGQG